MTTRQVADQLGVAENTLRRMEKKGFIPAGAGHEQQAEVEAVGPADVDVGVGEPPSEAFVNNLEAWGRSYPKPRTC